MLSFAIIFYIAATSGGANADSAAQLEAATSALNPAQLDAAMEASLNGPCINAAAEFTSTPEFSAAIEASLDAPGKKFIYDPVTQAAFDYLRDSHSNEDLSNIHFKNVSFYKFSNNLFCIYSA